ncbi:TPA: coiled-coil domain-containing protein, partial [Enterococcus faecium]
IAESETQIEAKLKDTNDKIKKANQDVATLNTNIDKANDRIDQTNQQIGDLGKLKKMYSNSIDFGDYDYSGNPNVMTKPYIAENITGGTTGLVVTSIDDGARIEKTRVDVPGGFELPLGNLLNNTDYIISYDVLVENGYTGDLKTCNIALEGQFDGKRNYIAVFYMNSVTSTDVWQKVYVKFNSGANMEKLSGFMFRVFLSQSVQVALKIKNVKIERGSTATPYQPNLLDAPYYLSKVALGENIITSKSYDNSNYLIGSFDINKTINNGDKLTFTIQGTKPANKQFGMYIQTTTGAATEFQGHLTPVEGLTDVWSWSSGAKISKPIGSGAKVVIYQLPPESQVPNGKCTISWAKLEKGDTRTPNISQFKYFGEGLKDSNNPNDYSWDITPEYAEKGLNDSVSLTEPQSVDGTKNFLETPLVNGKNVLVEEKPLPYEAWHSTGTEQTGISNKARLIIGPVATTIGAKLNRSMKENPLTWNSGNWQATANRDCTLLVEGLVRYQFGGSTAGQYGYITFYKDDAQTSSIGFAGGVGINGTALQWKHGLHFSRIFALKKGEYFNITFETQDGKKLDFSQINTLHIMEIES